MNLILKDEVSKYADASAKIVKVWHNATNLNNKSTFHRADGKKLSVHNRAANQAANRLLGNALQMQKDKKGFYIGRLFYANLITDLVPCNAHHSTGYLMPKGTEVLIEVRSNAFQAYYLNGLVWYSFTAVKDNRPHFRVKRTEFKLSNKPVIFSQKGKGLERPILRTSKAGVTHGFNFEMIK